MQRFLFVVRIGGLRRRGRFARHAIIVGKPAPEIRELATLTAERSPTGVHGLLSAVHAARFGACQTLLFNREASEVVNMPSGRTTPQGLATSFARDVYAPERDGFVSVVNIVGPFVADSKRARD
jgi:hypothetical protein